MPEKIKGALSKSPIRVILKSVGVDKISSEALDEVKKHSEEYARYIAIEAVKFAKHGKHKKITNADLDLVELNPRNAVKRKNPYLDSARETHFAGAQIRRFLKAEGAQLISKSAIAFMDGLITGEIEAIGRKAKMFCEHRNQKTINKDDILLSLNYQDDIERAKEKAKIEKS